MEYQTYAQIKNKVQKDLDLEGEVFIEDDELLGYANEAINQAESEIHTIYEDYFLQRAAMPITTGTEEYDLPADIYANKIRSLEYNEGSTTYTIQRLRKHDQFERYNLMNRYNSTDFYRYFIINPTPPDKPKVLLVPTSRETSSTAITIWYIRNATKMVDDTSICDIPEFVDFVIKYMKVKCYEKEGHPNLEMSIREREDERRRMISTLSNMVPDTDNTIEMDAEIFNEHS